MASARSAIGSQYSLCAREGMSTNQKTPMPRKTYKVAAHFKASSPTAFCASSPEVRGPLNHSGSGGRSMTLVRPFEVRWASRTRPK